MMAVALDRRLPPKANASKTVEFPRFERLHLASGLEVVLLDYPGVPLLSLGYGHHGGGQFDPSDQRGLASFTAALVTEGTSQRSASQLHREIEGRGGFLGSGSGWDASSVGLTVLAEHADFALELLAEIVGEPAFDSQEIERERALRLSEIDRRRDLPAVLANQRFVRAIHGDGVYGGLLSGERTSIESLDAPAMRSFWHRHSRGPGSYLIAAGDFGTSAADFGTSAGDFARRIEEAFAGLSVDRVPDLPAIETHPLATTEIHVVDRPQAAQTELRIGHVGVERLHPDRPALVVLNTLLGGKFTSRINLNLRERHGFTYGARSQFSDRRCPGPFAVSAAVETESAGAACREVVRELRRVRDEPIEAEEVADTSSYLIGVFPYSLQTLEGLTNRLEQIALYGLPDDYYNRFLDSLGSVTGEEVSTAAQRHLQPDRLAIVAVGPASHLVPQLEDMGQVQVHELP